MFSRLSLHQTAQLCHRVGLNLRAGVEIRKVWQQEAQRGLSAHRAKLDGIVQRLNDGEDLATSIREAGDFFPPLVHEMAEVGEQTGRQDEAFLRLAEHYQHVLELRRLFLTGIAWPGIQLGVAVVVIGALIWLLGVLGGERSVKVFGLSGTSGLLIYSTCVTLVTATIGAALLGFRQGWYGPQPLVWIMKTPVVGTSLKTMALARFSWSLAMALEAGIDARRSMALALRSTQNPYFLSFQEPVDQALIEGCEFHEALRTTRGFPVDFIHALEAAEISGTQTESLGRLAHDYQERAKASAKVLTVVASFSVWAFVAMIIIVLIIQLFMSVILPPYQEALDFLDSSS